MGVMGSLLPHQHPIELQVRQLSWRLGIAEAPVSDTMPDMPNCNPRPSSMHPVGSNMRRLTRGVSLWVELSLAVDSSKSLSGCCHIKAPGPGYYEDR